MLDLDAINALIGQTESLRLEFKSARAVGRLDDVAKHATAFANARGGTIVYGIEENDETDGMLSIATALAPLGDASRCADKLSAYLAREVSPALPNCNVYTVESTPGTNVGFIVVEVGESARGHQATDGRFYRRHSFGAMRMDERELRELLAFGHRADLHLVTLRPGSFDEVEPKSLVDAHNLVLGVANRGGTVETLYRVVCNVIKVDEPPGCELTFNGPDGYPDRDHTPREYGGAAVFIGSATYPAFPNSVVPILTAAVTLTKWSVGDVLFWSIVGASTVPRKGTIHFGV